MLNLNPDVRLVFMRDADGHNPASHCQHKQMPESISIDQTKEVEVHLVWCTWVDTNIADGVAVIHITINPQGTQMQIFKLPI